MAESAQNKRIGIWWGVIILAVVVLSLAATAAFAATVTQAPAISGDASTGSTLTAVGGSWTPASAKTEFSWVRCDASGQPCQGITGACGRSYVVRAADEGLRLRVRLTATDSTADSKESEPTDVVLHKDYVLPGKETDTCTHVTPTGPGQGTFSSGTQIGAGSKPAPNTSLQFIDPFPVVRISGRFVGKRTKLTRVTVRTPHGTRIQARCKGHGCPYKRKAVAATVISIRSLQRIYRPNAQIEIRVTQPDKIGKYTRIRTRRGKAPVRVDRCLMPGKTKPVTCPAG